MRSLIYNNIKDSTFSFEINDLKLYFSSEFYLNLFQTRLNYIDEEFYKISSRYKVFDERFYKTLTQIFTITLYKKIEKRGFYVIDLKTNEMIKG